jgi:hypothetical protein
MRKIYKLKNMKLNLLNTREGLKPCYDDDFDEKKKLKIGEVYKCNVTMYRNYDFHKKYFKLIKCAWGYQNEKTVAFFKHNQDKFRESVEIAAGNTETFYSIDRKEWIEKKRSVSFEKMNASEFDDLYNNVKRILFEVFLTKISEKEFNKNLINF